MMTLLLLEEGEGWIAVFLLMILSFIVMVGILVPIVAVVTYAIYCIRLKFNFTWQKDFVEMQEAQHQPDDVDAPAHITP